MDILCCWLTNLVPEEREESPASVAVMTNKIIQKHQKIIIFSEYIEDLYTYIALVQFTSNTVLICSLGFLIVTVSIKSLRIAWNNKHLNLQDPIPPTSGYICNVDTLLSQLNCFFAFSYIRVGMIMHIKMRL